MDNIKFYVSPRSDPSGESSLKETPTPRHIVGPPHSRRPSDGGVHGLSSEDWSVGQDVTCRECQFCTERNRRVCK